MRGGADCGAPVWIAQTQIEQFLFIAFQKINLI